LVYSFTDHPSRREKTAIVAFMGWIDMFSEEQSRTEWRLSCRYSSKAVLTDDDQHSEEELLELIVDVHFEGFTALGNFAGISQYKADIIAISGLGGHAFGSFKEHGGIQMWLQDFLPKDLASPTRILIYGYDTHLENSSSFQTITDLATSFAASLKTIRTTLVDL